MNNMGGSCSLQRQRAMWQQSVLNTHTTHGGAPGDGANADSSSQDGGSSSASSRSRRSLRHSVESEVPDCSISSLYPLDDNYVTGPEPNRRSPKSLTDLCIEAVCRSLPDMDGEIPPGLPQDMVDAILRSLVSHAALNATTLRALRRCEPAQLSLAGCRGVSDEWLMPLGSSIRTCSSTASGDMPGASLPATTSSPPFLPSSPPPPPQTVPGSFGSDSMEFDFSPMVSTFGGTPILTPGTYRAQDPPPLTLSDPDDVIVDVATELEKDDDENDMKLPSSSTLGRHERRMSEESSSSCSTSSFVSASSNHPCETLAQHTVSFAGDDTKPASSAAVGFLTDGTDLAKHCAATDDHNCLSAEADNMISNYYNYSHLEQKPAVPRSPPLPLVTSHLTLLDLCGSQRLTDRGLRQLSNLSRLEVAKLDHCHSLTGRGLVAFSSSNCLHTLSMANCRRLTDEAVVNISHLTSLQALSLDGCRCLTDRSLAAISYLVRLRKLDMSQCDLVTNDGLRHLRELGELEELSLGWCGQLTDEGVDILTLQPGRPERLRALGLARCPISDEGVTHLARLKHLEELDINGCSGVGSAAVGATLERLLHLTTLDVSYCPSILRVSWQGKIRALKSLDLCYSSVRDAHIGRLTSLPALEELNLDSCPVGDWAISHLATKDVVPNLTSLDLADTDLTDAGMAHLPSFTKMTRLSLFYCNITNDGLQHLSNMTNLEVLNLDSRDIGDEGLSHLRNLRKLRSLDIFSGRITDVGCAHLAKISSLESLELCGGGVGDAGCNQIAKLKNLTSLNLSQNERITNLGASNLAPLKKLKALNLSNTKVTSSALKFFSGLVRLQSLALYGCKGIDNDADRIELLQRELPSLKCLRLNGASEADGVFDSADVARQDGDDDDEEDRDSDEDDNEEDDEDEDDDGEGMPRVRYPIAGVIDRYDDSDIDEDAMDDTEHGEEDANVDYDAIDANDDDEDDMELENDDSRH